MTEAGSGRWACNHSPFTTVQDVWSLLSPSATDEDRDTDRRIVAVLADECRMSEWGKLLEWARKQEVEGWEEWRAPKMCGVFQVHLDKTLPLIVPKTTASLSSQLASITPTTALTVDRLLLITSVRGVCLGLRHWKHCHDYHFFVRPATDQGWSYRTNFKFDPSVNPLRTQRLSH